MAEQDKLLIRLHVYDTDLSVRIPREDEEYYRKSAKLIDDIVNSYTKIFKGRKSDKEILYMALIDVALRYEKESDRNAHWFPNLCQMELGRNSRQSCVSRS